MGKQKYITCECCGQLLPRTREFFKRYLNKTTNKEEYHSICRNCENKNTIEDNWRDGKLKCHVCGEFLDPSNFDYSQHYKYRNYKDKRCKKCKSLQNKKNKSEYDNTKKLKFILQSRWFSAKDRAETKGIPFTISESDLKELWDLQKGLCAISKIPMTYEVDNGRVFTNISIDQKNPGQGYTKDNIQLVCSAVNQLKSNWDMDTVLYICKQVINNYEK